MKYLSNFKIMFKAVFFTLLLFLLGSTNVYAFDSSKGVAMSVGTDYSGQWPWQADYDTTQDAINAQAAFSSMLFNSYYQNGPTYQYLRGNNPYTGKPRMESKILFFSGHGNANSMTFNYKQKNGDYKTGVHWGTNFDSSSSGYKYAGIKSYNMNKVKLVIFGGCQTAIGSDNIAKRANSSGAGTSIGWTTSINGSAHSQWFTKFLNELKKSGRTVQTAVNYANGFSYSDNRVKNVVIYGNTQYVPTWDSGSSKGNNISNITFKDNELKEYAINYKLDGTYEKESFATLIETLIKEKIDKNFNVKDYSYEINGVDKIKYYDFSYMVNGAKTLSSYTVVVENNILTKIIDNTRKVEQKDISSKNIITDVDLKQNLLDIKNEILKQYDNYEIISQENKVIYDLDEAKYKIQSLIELKDKETGTFFVVEDVR